MNRAVEVPWNIVGVEAYALDNFLVTMRLHLRRDLFSPGERIEVRGSTMQTSKHGALKAFGTSCLHATTLQLL